MRAPGRGAPETGSPNLDAASQTAGSGFRHAMHPAAVRPLWPARRVALPTVVSGCHRSILPDARFRPRRFLPRRRSLLVPGSPSLKLAATRSRGWRRGRFSTRRRRRRFGTRRRGRCRAGLCLSAGSLSAGTLTTRTRRGGALSRALSAAALRRTVRKTLPPLARVSQRSRKRQRSCDGQKSASHTVHLSNSVATELLRVSSKNHRSIAIPTPELSPARDPATRGQRAKRASRQHA